MSKGGLGSHMYFDEKIANFEPHELCIAISHDLELCNEITKIRNFLSEKLQIEFKNISRNNVLDYEETKQLFRAISNTPETAG